MPTPAPSSGTGSPTKNAKRFSRATDTKQCFKREEYRSDFLKGQGGPKLVGEETDPCANPQAPRQEEPWILGPLF